MNTDGLCFHYSETGHGSIPKRLLDKLAGLPLALAQSASFMRESGTNAASYIRLYDQQWVELTKSDNSSQLGSEYRNVATKWTVSFIRVAAISPKAAGLLQVWVFLDNQSLGDFVGFAYTVKDKRILLPLFDKILHLKQMTADDLEFDNAVQLLHRYSVIEVNGTGSMSEGFVYSVHPAVHRWMPYVQTSDDRYISLLRAFVLSGISLIAAFGHPIAQVFCIHIQKCCLWLKEFAPTTTSAEILGARVGFSKTSSRINYLAGRLGREPMLMNFTLMVASYLRVSSRIQEAGLLLDMASKGIQKILDSDHYDTLTVHSCLTDI